MRNIDSRLSTRARRFRLELNSYKPRTTTLRRGNMVVVVFGEELIANALSEADYYPKCMVRRVTARNSLGEKTSLR
jgi:hypothetical protein